MLKLSTATKTACAAHDLARDLGVPREDVMDTARWAATIELDRKIAERIRRIGKERRRSDERNHHS